MADNPKFKTFEELEEVITNNPESLGFACNPDPKCRECYGRGYTGRDLLRNKVIICGKCMSRKEG